jgi:hypothetical protein
MEKKERKRAIVRQNDASSRYFYLFHVQDIDRE